MNINRITAQEMSEFLATQSRYLYTQTPEYAAVVEELGSKVDLLGLYDGTSIVGTAVIVHQPWKRAFSRAVAMFGPVLDWNDERVVRGFFEEVVEFYKKERSVVSLRINPLLVRRPYNDVEAGDPNPAAAYADDLVKELGGDVLEGDLYSDPTMQIRFAYVKNIAGMTFKEAAASAGQVVRTGFNRAGTPGVTVRYLTGEEFDTFVELERHTADRTGMAMGSEAAFARYRALLDKLGPERAMLPAAILNCDDYLGGLAAERTEIEDKIVQIRAKEEELVAEGKALGKKQRNALKEHEARLVVLERRRAETQAIKDDVGNEVTLAAALFFATPNELVYLLSAARAEYQSYYGVYLIHREMFEWATSRGVSTYNFFGISGDLSEDACDAGVIHFKRQFNGDIEEYVGTYHLPVHKRMAKLLGA